MDTDVLWVKAWIESNDADDVLLLRCRPDGVLELVDPQEGGRTAKTFTDYDAARHWLGEDEYDLVEGRYVPRV